MANTDVPVDTKCSPKWGENIQDPVYGEAKTLMRAREVNVPGEGTFIEIERPDHLPVRVRAGETFFLEIQVTETDGQVEAREGDDWGLIKTETHRRITDRKVGPHPEMPHDWHESGDGGMYLCHLCLEGGDACMACDAISDAEVCPECGVTKGYASKEHEDACK